MRPPKRKRLGQHHLRQGSLCAPLIDFLRPSGRTVLEIGPGGGVLTRELLPLACRLIAVELDRAWAFYLRRRLPGVEIVVGDALAMDWRRLPPASLLAGNLPYGIATAVVESLLPHRATVERAAFLVQREVGERLVASPGSKAYGALSVLVAAASRASLLGRVRPGSFVPPPKVESVFVGLELIATPVPEARWPDFVRLVRASFQTRRKTLANSLRASWGRERVAAVLAAAGIDGRRRAESLSLDEFLLLFDAGSRV